MEHVVKLEEEKKSNKKKWLLLLLLLLIGTLVWYLLYLRPPGMFIAGDLLPEGRHAGEMVEVAQGLADESRFRMQVNTRIEFETPDAYGDIGIINPGQNTFPIAVDFILDETGETIFSSGAIHPNEFISQARLDATLPVGEHPATALFNVYDPETHEHVWTGNVSLTILIGQ